MGSLGAFPEAVPAGAPLPRRLLATAEVATLFRRSERTIRSWCQRGLLRPVRIGGAVFFREDDLRALLRSRLADAMLPLPAEQPGRPATSGGTVSFDVHNALKKGCFLSI